MGVAKEEAKLGSGSDGRPVPDVDDLRPEEAMAILRHLSERSDEVGEAVREEILADMLGFDPEDVSGEVLTDLELLTVEELWGRSGRTSQGYVDPNEESWVMVGEVLQPYVARIRQYQEWGRVDEGREYCLAVLDGLYSYIRESKAKFKDHAQDDPQIAFGWVEDQWREGVSKIALLDQFSEEVATRFPDWRR